MGFLDNSGDIILDAVLTDAGRKRLARGDGTFKVTKYAFGDDEIDYGKYQPNNVSGSAYYDLEILQTPILEAFTNNRSSLKSRLVSLTNNNLLYLPEMILNQVNAATALPLTSPFGTGSFYVAVDQETATKLDSDEISYINGAALNVATQRWIRVDQGLNTTKLDGAAPLSEELTERQYIIQIDNRLGSLVDVSFASNTGGNSSKTKASAPAFIDDDQIASYYLTQGVGGYIKPCKPGNLAGTGDNDPEAPDNKDGAAEVIPGPRGTKIGFALYAKEGLRGSRYLFETIGMQCQQPPGKTNKYDYISSTVRVTGISSGYRLDIPVTLSLIHI